MGQNFLRLCRIDVHDEFEHRLVLARVTLERKRAHYLLEKRLRFVGRQMCMVALKDPNKRCEAVVLRIILVRCYMHSLDGLECVL